MGLALWKTVDRALSLLDQLEQNVAKAKDSGVSWRSGLYVMTVDCWSETNTHHDGANSD